MDPAFIEYLAAGNTVYSSDGEKVGTVAAVHDAVIHVEKGFLFVHDYNIPLTAIARVDADNGNITLNLTKDEALNSDWEVREDEEPEEWSDEPPYDSPIDGEGDRVLTGAAETPSLPIIAELEEDDPPLQPDEAADAEPPLQPADESDGTFPLRPAEA